MTDMNAPRYRQTFSDALHAIPLLEDGDGLGWDQDASRWRIYSLRAGTSLDPEVVRVKNRIIAVSVTGYEIMSCAADKKMLH
jgi:hypothetical protein